MSRTPRWVVVLSTAVSVAASPRAAGAAGFASARFGGEHGTVVATNPTALYFNPAGIGFASGTHLFLDGELALRGATFSRSAAPTDLPDPPGAEGANTGRATLFNVFGGPALGVATRLGALALGAGVFVPFGGRERWSKSDHFGSAQYPLASDGVQRWHVIDGALTFIYLTAGVAYRCGPLSIGAAGNFIRSSITTTQAKNPAGSGLPDTAREGRAALDVSGVHASFGAGLMIEAVAERLWFGASYQAQPAVGPQTLEGTLALTSPAGATKFNVTLSQALPDIYRLGARWRPRHDAELRVFGDYTRWSVMQTQCVAIRGYSCAVFPDGSDASGGVLTNLRRGWKDTYGVRLGSSYWLRREVELIAGLGFETGAVPDATLEPGIVDGDNVALALGMRLLVGGWFHLAASYTHLQYFNRDNTGQSELARAQIPTQQQDAGGKYTQWIGLFDLNIEKEF